MRSDDIHKGNLMENLWLVFHSLLNHELVPESFTSEGREMEDGTSHSTSRGVIYIAEANQASHAMQPGRRVAVEPPANPGC